MPADDSQLQEVEHVGSDPMQVASVPGALIVPATALLAQSRWGYAVEVVGAGAIELL